MSLRILNISDIHFKENYHDEEIIKQYFNSFKIELSKIHSEKSIDLVVLNGDLAYSGQNAEYQNLYTILKSALPDDGNLPIVSIVGNHDVSWDYISVAIGKEKDVANIFKKDPNDIVKDLKSGNSKYRKAFINFYTVFEKETRQLFSEGRFEYKFDESLYCGYLYDKQEKVFLMLLNSAFFSFGKGVMESIFDDVTQNMSETELRNYCRNLLSNEISQNGKQSYFLNSYPFYSQLRDAQKNDAPAVIAIVHHPPSWVRYKEQFIPSKEKEIHLDKLFESCHLIVSGHLHSPISQPNLISDTCYHFSNGAFLEYSYIDEFKRDNKNSDPVTAFPNNWFVIMDVDQTGFIYDAYKLNTQDLGGFGNFGLTWKLESKKEFDFIPKNFHKNKIENNERPTDFRPVVPYFPKNIKQLSEILANHRKNEFKFAKGSANQAVNSEEIINLTFDTKPYLVFVNSIDKFQQIFTKKEIKFDELKNFPIFKVLIDLLEPLAEDNLPIIAFYEFFKSSNPSSHEIRKKYESQELEKFIKFQSFKHQFYNSFEELHKYKELSIVFDSFLL